MKKQDQTVENMIMQAHYLEALEIESKAQKPLAEMERQDVSVSAMQPCPYFFISLPLLRE